MKTQSITIKCAAAAMALAVSAGAELVSRGQNTGVGARALSMGEAFTGVADDYSALYYNPAGLTQLRKSELGINLDYSMRMNDASLGGAPGSRRTIEATRVNAVSLILTQGKGWAFGMGYYSPTTFDDPIQYFSNGQEYAYEAFGGMDHYRMALAFAPSKSAAIGFAVSGLTGREQLEVRDGITSRYLEEYAGFNLEPSFLFRVGDALTLGGSAVVAERLVLRDTYQEEGFEPLETLYEIRHPFQTRLGLGFQVGWTQLSADWHANFWRGYGYAEEGVSFFQTEESYANRHKFALGVEQHLSRRGPILRAGVSWEADDARAMETAWRERPKSLHLGFGLPASKHLLIDLGYHYKTATTVQPSTAGGIPDLSIAESGQHVMGSLRLRW
jgi:long-subunit fatty acid transport protein